MIKFDRRGKLKIMHITDTHIEDENFQASLWLIRKACEREMPRIVCISGDNVLNYSNAEKTKNYINFINASSWYGFNDENAKMEYV